MLSQLQQAFKGMIGESDWLDRITQRVTSQKVDAIKAEIGYPKMFETPEKLDKLYDYVNSIILYLFLKGKGDSFLKHFRWVFRSFSFCKYLISIYW